MTRFSYAQQDYINHNDLKGAYARFTSAYRNWKDHWWSVVVEIWDRCKEWAKDYVLDTVKRVLLPRLVKRGRKSLANVEYECDAYGMGAYIVQHYDAQDEPLWTKVGKANDVHKRLNEHLTKDYRGLAKRAVCLAFYPATSEDHALSIENVLRHHFNKEYPLLGNDRFPALSRLTDEDKQIIEEKLKILATIF